MDGFYSPGKERLHAFGAIDLALWDIKGKALNAPIYQLFGGKAREHIELYATSGLPQGIVPPQELVETMTEGAQGITHRRPDGSLTHW
jgi:L-alanine-DL-glutamate epimerase-like enolase superfamily enzyme